MRATIWGCRGSLATPGPGTVRYGGNTSCLAVETSAGRLVVIDAGTGIRSLGLSLLSEPPREIDLLLTHMHLDHVEGLGFFALIFREVSIRIWTPHVDGGPAADRIREYLSPPLFPRRFDELPAHIEFAEVEGTWQLDDLTVTAAPVQHPGGAVGYRLEEAGRSLAFVPDNELGLDLEAGLDLAAGADVLLHDAQYTAPEYADRVGWGHSSVEDFAAFVRRAEPRQAVMFHHDPSHDDATLEAMRDETERLADREIGLAAEGLAIDLPPL